MIEKLSDLTDSERRYLAMHARYESQRQDDFRYQEPDVIKRYAIRTRWNEIADALHRDPWRLLGDEEPTREAEPSP